MNWSQLVTPNVEIPYVGGLCEGFVEGTVGQATLPTPKNQMTYGVWGNAVNPVNRGETGAWNQNFMGGNHPGELPPKGVRVPVFFSLGSTPAGHVAIVLEDGRVASSTQAGYHSTSFIHRNMQDLIDAYGRNNKGCTYLGWSEYIGKVQVVKENDMSKPSIATLRIAQTEIAGSDFDYVHSGKFDSQMQAAWGGWDVNDYIYHMWEGSAEWRAYRIAAINFYNQYKDAVGELRSRPSKAELEAALAKLAPLQQEVTKSEEAAKQALAEKEALLAQQKADAEVGNALIRFLGGLFRSNK